MNPGMMLSNLIIGPLKLLFETIFALSNRFLDVGPSIVVLSFAVSVLVLPLYRRADAVQKEAQRTEARLAPQIRHIKSVFRGDEQFLILQTFYRQNHYSPLHALKGALPLLLQIPFFIAAYQFLSRLGSLEGASLGPVADLSRPDQLLRLGGFSLNLLPVLMTGINLLSGALYTRGAPLKSKLQTFGIALVFLALLYSSPSGLTFYWTLNNLFSLLKNLIQRILPEKKRKSPRLPKCLRGSPQPKAFILYSLLLALLTGLLIPSAVLSASPQEFIESIVNLHPLWYMVNSFLLAFGTFFLWFGVYYALSSPPVRKGMEFGGLILFGIFLINYLFFRNNLGLISTTLQYDRTPEFSAAQKLVNLLVLLPAGGFLFFLLLRKERLVRGIALTLALAMSVLSLRNLWIIQTESDKAYRVLDRNYTGAVEIPVSKNGKNVVVLMLDRAISSYLPCILYERPDLKSVYSGFVYYPNTLSYGMHTNLGSPALFGGYEYTPREMNARGGMLLRDKHNEALLLMPTLFSRQGYRTTVFDVPYPGNYSDAGDYSLFDTVPGVSARVVHGADEEAAWIISAENFRLRNFFCHSLTMTAPSFLFGTLYSMGSYNQAARSADLFTARPGVTVYSDLEMRPEFMLQYDVLTRLPEMTRLQSGGDTLLVMANATTHQPTLLREPEYVPSSPVDNTVYDAEHQDRFLAGPFALQTVNDTQMAHYEVNMAAMLLVGDWLQQLKELGVYDNTRIIIVADHGFEVHQIPEMILSPTGEDIMGYNPLLMVKDFGADGEIRTDTSFMTNADVPSLAMADLIEDPVNPFTGNPVNSDCKKNAQYVCISHDWATKENRGTVFSGPWYAVAPGGTTLFDPSRWQLLPEEE